MNQLAYEFDSVKDKNGVLKMNARHHANPVFIVIAKVGRSGMFAYVDKPELTLGTTTIESIDIIHNYVRITTENTIYTLRPTIKDV